MSNVTNEQILEEISKLSDRIQGGSSPGRNGRNQLNVSILECFLEYRMRNPRMDDQPDGGLPAYQYEPRIG